jgi:hypothetical protein
VAISGANFGETPKGELPRILIPRTSVNSPQPTPRSGRYSQRPEVFSEVQVPLKPMLWAGSATRDFTNGRVAVAHGSLRTCVAISFNSTNRLDTGLIAGIFKVLHTDTWLRAARSTYWCGGGAHPSKPSFHALPARALVVVLAFGAGRPIRLGPSNARDGGQRAPYEGCSHQLERLTSRDAAAGHSSSQLVEGVLSWFWGHWPPPPLMAGLVSPAVLRNVA